MHNQSLNSRPSHYRVCYLSSSISACSSLLATARIGFLGVEASAYLSSICRLLAGLNTAVKLWQPRQRTWHIHNVNDICFRSHSKLQVHTHTVLPRCVQCNIIVRHFKASKTITYSSYRMSQQLDTHLHLTPVKLLATCT